jgi:Protein of unknown function (DUF2568)
MLAAFGYWDFNAGSDALSSALLGIGAPLVAATVWGLLLSPRAPISLPLLAHLALQVVIFGLALALAASGQPTLGIVFAAVVAGHLVLKYGLGIG